MKSLWREVRSIWHQKPQCLHDIYQEVIERNGNQSVSCFRVREVESTSDFLICHRSKWYWDTQNGMPLIMYGLFLGPNFTSFYQMEAKQKIYTLLSSQDEVKYLKMVGDFLAIGEVKKNYEIIK